jgi:hypothetical protein
MAARSGAEAASDKPDAESIDGSSAVIQSSLIQWRSTMASEEQQV